MGGPVAMSGSILGISMAGSTYAMPITAAYPALAAILSTIFLKEKNPPRVWIGVFICIIGACVIGYVTPASQEVNPNFRLGIILSCVAALGWAFEGVVSTYGMDTLDPDIVLNIREYASTAIFAFVILPLISNLNIFGDTSMLSVTVKAFSEPIILLIVLAGFLGGTAYLLWYRALNTTGVARCMALDICYALWSVILGVLLTEQELTKQSLIGAIIIVAGALLVVANPKELLILRKN